MGTSHAYVDWDRTMKQVERAARDRYGNKNYAPSREVADYIYYNPDKYLAFRGLSLTAVQLRTTIAIKKMKWKKRSCNCRNGSIFITPWNDLKNA